MAVALGLDRVDPFAYRCFGFRGIYFKHKHSPRQSVAYEAGMLGQQGLEEDVIARIDGGYGLPKQPVQDFRVSHVSIRAFAF